jgi:hypothetical protein
VKVEVRVTTLSVALLVQRRAADPAVVIIVREPRDGHTLINVPTRHGLREHRAHVRPRHARGVRVRREERERGCRR